MGREHDHDSAANLETDSLLYDLVLLNDDTHSYVYVTEMLQRILGIREETAQALTRSIDETGRAVVFTGSLDEVNHKRLQVIDCGADTILENSRGPLNTLIEVHPSTDAVRRRKFARLVQRSVVWILGVATFLLAVLHLLGVLGLAQPPKEMMWVLLVLWGIALLRGSQHGFILDTCGSLFVVVGLFFVAAGMAGMGPEPLGGLFLVGLGLAYIFVRRLLPPGLDEEESKTN